MPVKEISINELRRMNGKEGLVLQGCGGDLLGHIFFLPSFQTGTCKEHTRRNLKRETILALLYNSFFFFICKGLFSKLSAEKAGNGIRN